VNVEHGAPPSPGGAARHKATTSIAVAILVVGALIRLLYLDADPRYYAWAGYVTDEGRWTQQAREIALFGSLDLEYWLAVVHLAVAPLYQAATWVSFVIFGVGVSSARAVSAAAGIVVMIFVWRFLSRGLAASGALLALALVAFQRDLVFLSRVAIPEMAAGLFELVAFAVLVAGPRSAPRAFLAGLATAVGLGFKGTSFPIVPVMVAVIVVVHDEADPSGRVAKAGSYLGAVVGSAILAAFSAEALTGIGLVSRLSGMWPALVGFVELAPPYAAATFLFFGDHATSIGIYLLGAWLIMGLLLGTGRFPRAGAPRAIYLGSAAWAIGWLGVGSALDYFPERYTFHALIPLAINIGAGFGALRTADTIPTPGFGSRDGSRTWLVAGWLVVPVAFVLAPTLIALSDRLIALVDRFSGLILVLAVSYAVAAVAAARWRTSGRVAAGLVVFSALALGGWLLASATGLVARGFWPIERAIHWPVIALVAGTTSFAVVRRAPVPLHERASLAVGALMASVSLLGLVQSALPLTSPTYSLVTIGSVLEERLSGEGVVWTDQAASVFLGTSLKYRERLEREAPDLLVDVFTEVPRAPATYGVVETYDIELGAEYMRLHEHDSRLRVFQREP
jgi:hypothetical protein